MDDRPKQSPSLRDGHEDVTSLDDNAMLSPWQQATPSHHPHVPQSERMVMVGWTGEAARLVSERIKMEQEFYPVRKRDTDPLVTRVQVTYPGQVRMLRCRTEDGTSYPMLGILVNPVRDAPKRLPSGMVDTAYNIAFIGTATQQLLALSTAHHISERYGLHIIDPATVSG